MINDFKKFIKYFGQRRKFKLFVFGCLSLIAGMLEFIGIALIYPFVILIVQPETAVNYKFYNILASITNSQNIIFNALIIGLGALVLFVSKNLYMVYFTLLQSKFTNWWKCDIISRFMNFYIYCNYKNSIKISPSDKLYIMNTLCPQAINVLVTRALSLITNSIIIGMVILLIMVKFPLAGFVTLAFVCISLFLQNKFFKRKIAFINEKINKENQELNKINYANVQNIKEVKILSAENYFYNGFKNQLKKSIALNINSDFYGSIPPYIVEILIVLALLILGVIISVENISSQSTLIASFALIAAAIFRTAPALNRVQTAIINISANKNYAKALIKEYEKLDIINFETTKISTVGNPEFNNKIELRNINFSYTDGVKVLNNINLEINKGDFIGIIGLSGAGKTTLVDILTGLLPVDSGEILIDGKKLDSEDFIRFRKIIGYVPQEIKILEGTFKENVAWGVPKDEIDEDKVVRAIRDAQLYDFVKSYEENIEATPFIGSTGASLGQKQRLAIARALYREPEILILDEATSSLDVKTEHEITNMLCNIRNNKTMIAIAHRLSTLKACNKLVYMKDGEVLDTGTFDELSSKYKDFEQLVRLSSIK